MFRYLALIFLCSTCHAKGPFILYGVGLNDNPYKVKFGALGYEAPAFSLFNYKLEAGGFTDSNNTPTFQTYVSPSIGVQTPTYPLYIKIYTGMAALSNYDSRLTSWWQFNHDFELGLRAEEGVSIGVNYKHMSNAGFVGQNFGRDFFLFKLQLQY